VKRRTVLRWLGLMPVAVPKLELELPEPETTIGFADTSKEIIVDSRASAGSFSTVALMSVRNGGIYISAEGDISAGARDWKPLTGTIKPNR